MDVAPWSSAFQLQPHKGSSETAVIPGFVELVARFNPTRVRLKPAGVIKAAVKQLASTPQGFV